MKEFIQEKNLTNANHANHATIHSTQKAIAEGMKCFVTIENLYEYKNQRKSLDLQQFIFLKIKSKVAA